MSQPTPSEFQFSIPEADKQKMHVLRTKIDEVKRKVQEVEQQIADAKSEGRNVAALSVTLQAHQLTLSTLETQMKVYANKYFKNMSGTVH